MQSTERSNRKRRWHLILSSKRLKAIKSARMSFSSESGSIPVTRRLSCKLQGSFRCSGDLAATCREVSGTPETSLQPAGSFPDIRKSSCKLQESFRQVKGLPADCRALLYTYNTFLQDAGRYYTNILSSRSLQESMMGIFYLPATCRKLL